MRNSRWMLIVAVTVVLACTPELSTRERVVIEATVEEQLNAWVKYMNNARRDSLFSMYHQVPALVVLWPEGKKTSGWEATEAEWQNFYSTTSFMNFVPQSPEIEILSPTAALATFRHSTDIVTQGRRQPTVAGSATVLWMRDPSDGMWKIRASHISRDPFVPTQPARRR